MVFVKKGDFLIFSFYAKWIKKKCFLKVPKEKRSLFRAKKHRLKKPPKIFIFSEVSPWFLSKNGDFLIFSFYAKLIKKKCFFKVPKEKKPFQSKRTSAQKTIKICIFFKLVSPWFLSKNGNFLILSFFAKWIKEKCF